MRDEPRDQQSEDARLANALVVSLASFKSPTPTSGLAGTSAKVKYTAALSR